MTAWYMSDPTIWRRLMSNCDCDSCRSRKEKMKSTQKDVDKLVALALEFHVKTGADIDLIKQFISDVTKVTTDSAIETMKQEVRKSFSQV